MFFSYANGFITTVLYHFYEFKDIRHGIMPNLLVFFNDLNTNFNNFLTYLLAHFFRRLRRLTFLDFEA